MYEYVLDIPSTYVGPERKLTVPWLFRIFQDAAIADCESIGYGDSSPARAGLLWVFSRVYVRFDHMPDYLSKVKFLTYSGGRKAFFFLRHGKLVDEKGALCAQISSVWGLIHEQDRKVELHPALESIDETDGSELPTPGKVVSAPVHYHGSKTVEYADIDLNGHFNNVRYLELLVNLRQPDFYQKWQFSELLIQYETEIRAGERVEIFVDDDIRYVKGVVGDRICFEANIAYAPVKK